MPHWEVLHVPYPTLDLELLQRKVLPLRERGLTVSEMSCELDQPIWRINYAVRLLLAFGLIEPRPTGYRSPRKQLGQDDAIVRLRKANVSNRRIAAITGLALHKVYRRVAVLKKRGLIESRANGRTAVPAKRMLRFWKNPHDPEFARFVADIRKGVPNKRIGYRLGCTGTRVAQIRAAMLLRYGPAVFGETEFLTTAQFARQTGLTLHQVYKRCLSGALPARRRGPNSRFMIARSLVAAVVGGHELQEAISA